MLTLPRKLKAGGLFSGIAGFELGLVRAGFEIAWMVEIDEFCQKVLRKHAPAYWPNAKILGDIHDVGKHNLEPVDVIVGGFPCQPFSQAGKQRGQTDDRYLWPEMLRVIRELKPRWIIGENVTGFISMELENAFTDLETEGYKVEAFVLPACAVGAPHRRERIWILAYANGGSAPLWGNGKFQPLNRNGKNGHNHRGGAEGFLLQKWEVESRPCGVVNGIPYRVDRNNALGNSIVPQIPEILGRLIIAADPSQPLAHSRAEPE